LRFIPIVCLFDSGHFFSHVAVKKEKNVDSSSSGDRFWDYFAVMRVLPDMTV
jgi:hypothetical protein